MSSVAKSPGSADGLPRAEYAVLQLANPGREIVNIGILVLDPVNDTLHIRMRSDWSGFADADVEILSELAADLQAKAVELGPSGLMAYLEDTLSNALRITERKLLDSGAVIGRELLEHLYRREVLT